MKKTTSLALGMVFLSIAFLLFCTDNLACAAIGAVALLFALVFFKYTDNVQQTQDERRHRTNRNKQLKWP